MIELQLVMKNIDIYRNQKGYTIEEFVKGITSERSYRRYLYDGNKLPFSIFVRFVERLDINLLDFFATTFAELQIENKEILYAFSLCVQGKYKQSNEYLELAKKEGKRLHAYDTLMQLVEATNKLELKQISKNEYFKSLEGVYDLELLLSNDIITKQQIYALGVISKYTDDATKQRISQLFYNFLSNENFQVLVSGVSGADVILVEKGIEIIGMITDKTEETSKLVSSYIPHLFKLLESSHYVLYLSFVEALHKLLKYNNIELPETAYYFYVLKFMNEGRFITKEDLEVYNIDYYFDGLSGDIPIKPFKAFCMEVANELK